MPCDVPYGARRPTGLRRLTALATRTPPLPLLARRALAKATGVAFMFNFRMGVGITLGGGHGFVMARLPNGGWSAPLLIMVDQGALLFDLACICVRERRWHTSMECECCVGAGAAACCCHWSPDSRCSLCRPRWHKWGLDRAGIETCRSIRFHTEKVHL